MLCMMRPRSRHSNDLKQQGIPENSRWLGSDPNLFVALGQCFRKRWDLSMARPEGTIALLGCLSDVRPKFETFKADDVDASPESWTLGWLPGQSVTASTHIHTLKVSDQGSTRANEPAGASQSQETSALGGFRLQASQRPCHGRHPRPRPPVTAKIPAVPPVEQASMDWYVAAKKDKDVLAWVL